MQPTISLLVAMLFAVLFTATVATPIQQLSAQLEPQGQFQPQQTPSFTDVTIVSIDKTTFNFVDGTPGQDKNKPLFIYDKNCVMSFKTPVDTQDGDLAQLNFIWCEEDDKGCDASSRYKVQDIALTAPETVVSTTFKIPHLSWTKYFSSIIQFEIDQTRGPTKTFISKYQSQYKYPSDITTKGTKTVVIVVAVFCSVLVAFALAVLGYLIFKKVKKMRRERHFGTSEHNYFRRK